MIYFAALTGNDITIYVKYTVPALNDLQITLNRKRKSATKTFLNH